MTSWLFTRVNNLFEVAFSGLRGSEPIALSGPIKTCEIQRKRPRATVFPPRYEAAKMSAGEHHRAVHSNVSGNLCRSGDAAT